MKSASILLAMLALAANLLGGTETLASEDAKRHTAQYQPAPSSRYNISPPAGGSAYERYVAPPNNGASGVSPPPDVVERTQSAVIESGSALRQGVETGIQQANEQLSKSGGRIVEGASNVGQGFGAQLEDLGSSTARQFQFTGDNLRNTAEQTMNTTGDGLRQVGEMFGVTGTSPPPGASGAAASAPAANGMSPPPWPAGATSIAPTWSPASGATGGAGATNANATAARTVTTPVSSPGTLGATGRTSTASGWTSFDNNVAAPVMLTPSMAPPEASVSSGVSALSTVQNSSQQSGPQLPELPPLGRGTLHSPLVDPATSSRAPDQSTTPSGWPSEWSRPATSAVAGQNQPASPGDPFGQPPVTGSPNGSPSGRGNLPAPTSNAGNPWAATGTSLPIELPPLVTTGQNLPANQVQPAGATGGNAPAAAPVAAAKDTRSTTKSPANIPAGEQPPWMTLVLVSLTLIGSVSANLFLGWSYMDARQKYRTLARKTADKFRIAAEAA